MGSPRWFHRLTLRYIMVWHLAARSDRQGWPSRLPCLSRRRCQATP